MPLASQSMPRTRDAIVSGQLAFPLAFAGLPLYIHAPDYYAADLGVSLATLGAVLLLLRLADAVVDPWFGRMSDRLGARRLPLLLVALLVFAVSVWGLFHPPAQYPLAWFALTTGAATLSFSVLTINLNALGSQMAGEDQGKTLVTTWRESFAMLGLLVAIALPSLLPSLQAYGDVMTGVVIVSGVVFMLWLRGQGALLQSSAIKEQGSIFKVWRRAGGAVQKFYIAYATSMLASSLPAVLVLFFIRDNIGAEGLAGVFLALYLLCGLLAMPLWRVAVARYGMTATWAMAMAVSVAGLLPALFLGAGDVFPYALVCIVSGLGFGGEMAVAPALLSRRIDAAGLHGESATFFGFYALCMKAAMAMASAIGLVVLDRAGFVPAGVENTPQALATLCVLYAGLPVILKFCAIWLLMSQRDHDRNIT